MRRNHITLCWTEQPLAREIEADLSQVLICAFFVCKFSVNEICPELVEDTGVKDSHFYAVDTKVVAEKDVVAIFHNSESNFAHCIPTVF